MSGPSPIPRPLLMTVGNSVEPLLLSIAVLQPSVVLPVVTKQSKPVLATLRKVVDGLRGPGVGMRWERPIAVEPDDPTSGAAELTAVIGERDPDILFLGGTAAMTAALVAAWSVHAQEGRAWYLADRSANLIGLAAPGFDPGGRLTGVETRKVAEARSGLWTIRDAFPWSVVAEIRAFPSGWSLASRATVDLPGPDETERGPAWPLGRAVDLGALATALVEVEYFGDPAGGAAGGVTDARLEDIADLLVGAGVGLRRSKAGGLWQRGAKVQRKERIAILRGSLLEVATFVAVARRLDAIASRTGASPALDYSLTASTTSTAGSHFDQLEVDLVVRSGPRVSIISIGSGGEGPLTQKAIEAAQRAQQLGGSEARSLTLVRVRSAARPSTAIGHIIQKSGTSVDRTGRHEVAGLSAFVGLREMGFRDQVARAELPVLEGSVVAALAGAGEATGVDDFLTTWLEGCLYG